MILPYQVNMNIMRSTNDIKHSYGCGIQGPHTFERSVNLYKDFSDQLRIFWKKPRNTTTRESTDPNTHHLLPRLISFYRDNHSSMLIATLQRQEDINTLYAHQQINSKSNFYLLELILTLEIYYWISSCFLVLSEH